MFHAYSRWQWNGWRQSCNCFLDYLNHILKYLHYITSSLILCLLRMLLLSKLLVNLQTGLSVCYFSPLSKLKFLYLFNLRPIISGSTGRFLPVFCQMIGICVNVNDPDLFSDYLRDVDMATNVMAKFGKMRSFGRVAPEQLQSCWTESLKISTRNFERFSSASLELKMNLCGHRR